MPRSAARAPLAILSALSLVSLVGCATPSRTDPVTTEAAVRIAGGGVAVEVVPALDRYTYFGPTSGPNLLFTTSLEQPPRADGSYTFYGGVYTWNSPQNAPFAGAPGWHTAEGAPLSWPPDPAMDVGPVRRTGSTTLSLTTTGPVQRSGLVEVKTIRLTQDGGAELLYRLSNTSDRPRTAGPWITNAADPSGVLAIRMPEGSQVWGWDARAVELFRSIASAPDERGWVTLDLAKADWDGGVKVYIEAPAGEAGPVAVEIASWHGGHWFHRVQPAQTAEQASRLRELGEGPVAVYLEPRSRIVEAELYAPIAELAPGASTSVTELWRVVAAPRGDVSRLP